MQFTIMKDAYVWYNENNMRVYIKRVDMSYNESIYKDHTSHGQDLHWHIESIYVVE